MPKDLLAPRQGRDLFAPKQQEQPAYSGSILPFSRSQEGEVYFDPNAGIVGAVKRAVTLPGDVATGKVDPMSQEGIERATELGAMVSPTGAAARAARVPKMLQRKAKPPSQEALRQAGADAFKRARKEGVEYSIESVDDLVNTVRRELHEKGVSADLAPKTFKVLDDLQNVPDEAVAVPFKNGLDAARKRLRRASKPSMDYPEEPLAASISRRRIMDFVEVPPDQAVVAGTPAAARRVGQEVIEGNANYAAAKRSEELAGLQTKATRRAAAANSGANIGNTIRQRVASLLENPKRIRAFNEAEQIALDRISRGTPAQNISRDVGNMLGGGGGLGGMLTSSIGGGVGASIGGVPGAVIGVGAPMVTGRGSKALSNALTRRAMQAADEMTRARSPLAAQQAPVTAVTPAQQSALIRALLMSEMSGGRY